MLQLTFNQFQELQFNVAKWSRILNCQAWYGYDPINKIYLVKSYDTIVAYDDDKTLYSLGRFSRTTYQHVRKYRDNYAKDGYKTNEVNLELVNWFK